MNYLIFIRSELLACKIMAYSYLAILHKYYHLSLNVMCMYGKTVEFDLLIPVKFCFWREIFALLRENLSFGWILWSFSSHFDTIFNHFQGNFALFPISFVHVQYVFEGNFIYIPKSNSHDILSLILSSDVLVYSIACIKQNQHQQCLYLVYWCTIHTHTVNGITKYRKMKGSLNFWGNFLSLQWKLHASYIVHAMQQWWWLSCIFKSNVLFTQGYVAMTSLFDNW